MEIGLCILLSAIVVCRTIYTVAEMMKESFDTWIRTTDGWNREVPPEE